MNGSVLPFRRALALTVFAVSLGLTVPMASPAIADEPDLAPVVAAMVDGVIIPEYGQFAAAAAGQAGAMKALCDDPQAENLAAAREGFASLVDGFARVEAMRFGPARAENRFEKLFFWPDRRSRGLRQVQDIIRTEDASALDAAQLAEKSVAVQGLLALDYALAGEGAEPALLKKGSFRCGYASAVSRRIATTAEQLYADWSGASGYGAELKNAGPDGHIYRTSGEALQEILRAAVEMLTIDRDFKIGRVIGASAAETRIQKAPLWRSGLWLRSVDGNLAFVEALFDGESLAGRLDEENQSLPRELRFELSQARKAIAEASGVMGRGNGDAEFGPEVFGLLKYATVPIHGAGDILESRLPQALGLTLGFNSLDGD